MRSRRTARIIRASLSQRGATAHPIGGEFLGGRARVPPRGVSHEDPRLRNNRGSQRQNRIVHIEVETSPLFRHAPLTLGADP